MPALSPQGLERRLKRHLLKELQSFFLPCAPGFEAVLAQEVSSLPDNRQIQVERGGVAFRAALDAMYHANLNVRTAHRVLLRVDDFLAQSYPMLFNQSKKLPWELYLGFQQSYSLQVSAKTSRLRHHKQIAKTLHEAILNRLLPLGLKPEQRDDAPLSLQLRFFQDRCTISVNTSGEHLHKRGYRSLVSEAPLRETLAASILLKTKAATFQTLVDPMCGSGTLLIEAAALASHKAAGLARSFAFEHAPFFQASKWERLKREAKAQETLSNQRLIGIDIAAKTVSIARRNAQQAGCTFIDFYQGDARNFKLALDPGSTLILSNLPYGERLESAKSLNPLLADFARHLREQYRGCHFAFVSKDLAWLEPTYFDIQESLAFSNGGLKVYLVLGYVAR